MQECAHWQAGRLALSVLLLTGPARAQQVDAPPLDAQVGVLQDQLAVQRKQIDALSRTIERQEKSLRALQAASASALLQARGTGSAGAQVQEGAQGTAGSAASAPEQAQDGARPPAQASEPVGQRPARDTRPPDVAPLFEQPGVLTPKGQRVLEPSIQYAYSSSNRVALVGYTIIPALLIGLIDVREIKRNVTTGALTGRFGLSNRFELEARLPYVYRTDSTVSRELFTGASTDNVFETSGKALGDIELAARYQLNAGGPDQAYYVGALRFKSRSGKDPFTVVTDCLHRCVGDNAAGTGLPLTLPTGSGFYSLQPSLTWLYPSDPAVLFASASYLHNFTRNKVSRTVLGGEQEFLGQIAPGDVLGFNAGLGLALNEKTSFSLGYDHASVARTRQNGLAVPGSVRTELGTLLLGFSYRVNAKKTINIAVGAGLTRDTPDVTLTLRAPLLF